jgi:hypothetical protein
VIQLFGVTIHEPDVVFTDLALAAAGAWFGWRLWNRGRGPVSRAGAVLMGGLAAAAFWGAIFHAFFPDETATTPGFIAWIPVALSILLAAATMLHLALRLLAPSLWATVRGLILGAYATAFLAVVFLVDESFGSIVRFYAPALALLLLGTAHRALASRRSGWIWMSAGLLLSAVAALLQQAKVGAHPEYFDHNAVYHVLQGFALGFIYLGFRAVPEGGGTAYGAGINPATRPE